MEPKIRTIPLTIFDIFVIIIPGSLWLLLLVTAYGILVDLKGSNIPHQLAPFSTTVSFLKYLSGFGTGFGSIIFFIGSLIIGYSLKPFSMQIAELIIIPITKLKSANRKAYFKSLEFPFPHRFTGGNFISSIFEIVEHATGYNITEDATGKIKSDLPGRQPFSTVKRLLRLTSPELWEDGERMEIEARMTGTLFSAFVFSFVLSLFCITVSIKDSVVTNTLVWVWFLLSLIFTIILAQGFLKLRKREVDYTYLNILLATKHESKQEND